jgi:hypothetical protein
LVQDDTISINLRPEGNQAVRPYDPVARFFTAIAGFAKKSLDNLAAWQR